MAPFPRTRGGRWNRLPLDWGLAQGFEAGKALNKVQPAPILGDNPDLTAPGDAVKHPISEKIRVFEGLWVAYTVSLMFLNGTLPNLAMGFTGRSLAMGTVLRLKLEKIFYLIFCCRGYLVSISGRGWVL
mgnify:CR=1 FL=1